MPSDATIRRLVAPADAESFRAVRLEALRKSPEAFSSDYRDEAEWPLERFAGRLETSLVLGAFEEGRLVGMAGFYVEPGAKRVHKGYLVGVYVRPSARGRGLARRLVSAILGEARERVEIVLLGVGRANTTARRLYTELGFQEYGLERDALKVGDRYIDEVLMALDLRTD